MSELYSQCLIRFVQTKLKSKTRFRIQDGKMELVWHHSMRNQATCDVHFPFMREQRLNDILILELT